MGVHEKRWSAHESPPRRISCRCTARLACTLGLTGVLAIGGTLGTLALAPEHAYAASEETLAELRALQSEVSNAAETYADATSKADELNTQVDAIADEILEIEEDLLPARQQRAASAASDLYKTHASSGNMIALLLNASSFADFINLTKYLGTVQDANVAALNELDALKEELNGKLAELSEAKDQADEELERAATALGQAQSAAAQLQAKANAEDAEEAEIARKAAEEAKRLEAQQNANQTPINSLRVAATREAPRTDRRPAAIRTPTKAMATREARAETRAAKALAAVATAATIRAVRPIPPVPG